MAEERKLFGNGWVCSACDQPYDPCDCVCADPRCAEVRQRLDEEQTASMLARKTNRKLCQTIDAQDLDLQDERRRVETLTQQVEKLKAEAQKWRTRYLMERWRGVLAALAKNEAEEKR